MASGTRSRARATRAGDPCCRRATGRTEGAGVIAGANPDGGFGSNDEDEDEGSEDDWEPVVTKRRGGGGRRGGRRHDDDLDERVAALRI